MKNKIKKISTIFLSSMLISTTLGNNTSLANNNKELLNEYYAQKIYDGRITLEDGRIDTLLFRTELLDPNGDDDNDGLKNSEEIYIYTKNNIKYLGYNSNPKLLDTDGDGIQDRDDKNPLVWDISARDMAMFMELSYREDGYIAKVLDENRKLNDLYDNRIEYTMMHKELAPFWKIKESYHLGTGFDAVLFETSSNFPYLKNGTVQVLGIRGTKGTEDIDDDLLLFGGNNPEQAYSVINLIDQYSKLSEINNLYITGHSLGGYLAQRANIYANNKNYKFIKKTYTFNAPKIKGSIFWSSLKKAARDGDILTSKGKAIHYVVNNDSTISWVGTFKNAINIGNTARGHSSRSYFEAKLNNQPGFSIGNRATMDGYGYSEYNLENIFFYNIGYITQKDNEYFNPILVEDPTIIANEGEVIKPEKVLEKIINVPDEKNFKEKPKVTIQETKNEETIAKVIFLYKDNTQTTIEVPIKYKKIKKEDQNSNKNKTENIKEDKENKENSEN